MIDLNILRLEINYFLHTVELALGYEDRCFVEEALNTLINQFLFNKNADFSLNYIENIQEYFETISTFDNDDYSLLKNNTPTIIELINNINKEQYKKK